VASKLYLLPKIVRVAFVPAILAEFAGKITLPVAENARLAEVSLRAATKPAVERVFLVIASPFVTSTTPAMVGLAVNVYL